MRLRPQHCRTLLVWVLIALLGVLGARPAQAQSVIVLERIVTCYGQGLTTGPDGNIWIAETRCDRIGRITPSGAVAEFQLPENTHPVGIITGPDGNLWFTVSGRNALGRITPGGRYREIGLQLEGFSPGELVIGPDGLFWFTYAHGIARASTTGEMFTYPLEGVALNSGITLGPDGNMWFATGSGVGSISIDGQVRLFETGNSSYDIEVGADGNLWFTNYRGIGRITTGGDITFFPVRLDGQELPPTSNIVLGPDGAMWFGFARQAPSDDTTYEARVARILPDGRIETVSLGYRFDSAPMRVAVGPEGQIWYYQKLRGTIGAVVGRLGRAPGAARVYPALVALSQQIAEPEQARPGGTLTYTIVAANYGRGGASEVVITMPFDPAAVRLIDARFSRPETWVSQVQSGSLTIRTGPLDRSDVVTGTVRLAVRASAPPGAPLAPRLRHTWRDDRGGGAGRSNQLLLSVGGTGAPQNPAPLTVERADTEGGRGYRFSSSTFVPGEPVAFWYNTPDGRAVALEGAGADSEGAVSLLLPPDGLAPGAYSLVARGLWSHIQSVSLFGAAP